MNVSNPSRYCVPTRRLSATGWFVIWYFGAIFIGMLGFHFLFS